MPYSLITDTFETDPLWEVLSGGNGQLIDSLQASWVRMNTRSSHQLSNGYLTESAALACCRGRRAVLEKLTASVLGRAPRLHRKGDSCPCLGDEWIDGYGYRLHKFLKRNPSKAEYRRNVAQKADRRDARLKAAVFDRDGGCCRYCRSGPLSQKAVRARDRRKVLHFDHVDPDQPAGPNAENYVTACAECNEWKGHRTPHEADMVLLPVPTPAQCAAWAQRGLALFDRLPITDGSPTDQQHVADRVADPITDPDADPNAISAVDARAETGAEQPDQQHDQPVEGDGMGRVGSRTGADPSDTARPLSADRYGQQSRTPDAPDIWTRRSRADPAPTPRTRW